MELPNRARSQIPLEKIREYLLSETHPVGKSKAKFFRSYGFKEENASVLTQGLLAIARNSPVGSTEISPFGTKYILDRELETPNGDMMRVRTVWIIENQDEVPRFVTAYQNADASRSNFWKKSSPSIGQGNCYMRCITSLQKVPSSPPSLHREALQ